MLLVCTNNHYQWQIFDDSVLIITMYYVRKTANEIHSNHTCLCLLEFQREPEQVPCIQWTKTLPPKNVGEQV